MGPTNWFRSHFSSDDDNDNSSKKHHQNALNNTATQSTAVQQSTAPSSQVKTAPSDHPTVIEVFQSQGCNSCPPTNSLLLSKMAQSQNDPNVLILDYHVTYWDRLGWKDPFGVPEADDHQREYAHAKGTSRVYTPQVIVNGVAEGVGNTARSLDGLIAEGERKASERSSSLPWLSFTQTPQGILISDPSPAGKRREGRIVEVLYDPAAHEVYIPRGENARRTLVQRNTVKSVRDLGTWTDGQAPLKLAPRANASDGLQRVLLVQEGRGGPIIGVSRISF